MDRLAGDLIERCDCCFLRGFATLALPPCLETIHAVPAPLDCIGHWPLAVKRQGGTRSPVWDQVGFCAHPEIQYGRQIWRLARQAIQEPGWMGSLSRNRFRPVLRFRVYLCAADGELPDGAVHAPVHFGLPVHGSDVLGATLVGGASAGLPARALF